MNKDKITKINEEELDGVNGGLRLMAGSAIPKNITDSKDTVATKTAEAAGKAGADVAMKGIRI